MRSLIPHSKMTSHNHDLEHYHQDNIDQDWNPEPHTNVLVQLYQLH